MTPEQRDQLGERLCAYLDGELSANESTEIESLLEGDAEACALLAELRIASGAVRDLPSAAAPREVLEGITSHIERTALLGDAEREVTLARHKHRPVRSGLAVAAVVALAIGGGFYVSTRLTHTSPSQQVADAEATPPPQMKPEHLFNLELQAMGKAKPRLTGEGSPATGDVGAGVGVGAKTDATAEAKPVTSAMGLPAEETGGNDALAGMKEKRVPADGARQHTLREIATSPPAVDATSDKDGPLGDLVAELGTRIAKREGVGQGKDANDERDSLASSSGYVEAATPPSALPAGRADLALDATKGTPGTAPSEPPSLGDRTFEKRLALGEGLAAARDHAFANEPLQLKLAFSDREAQLLFEQRMRHYFLRNHVRPLDEANPPAVLGGGVERASGNRLRSDTSASPTRSQVFVRGAPERNYRAKESGERQYLLRVPTRLIGGLIDLAEAFHPLQVELDLSRIKAEGAMEAKRFVQGLSVAPERKDHKPLDVAAPFDMLALLERVGLSPVMGVGKTPEKKTDQNAGHAGVAGASGGLDTPVRLSGRSKTPEASEGRLTRTGDTPPSKLPRSKSPAPKIAQSRVVEATEDLVTLVVDLSTREPAGPPQSQPDGETPDTNG